MNDEHKYYIFDPNTGKFISGPFTCKNWARVCMREKQPQAGAPENEPYMVVELDKEDIIHKKVRYERK